MPELSYRQAARADLPFMVNLIAEDDVSGLAHPWSAAEAPDYEAALAAIDADPNQELVIAELDGAPVGTLQLTFIPGIMRKGMWRGLVESVHIVPGQRNKGLGKTMMRWATERCRERGCELVQLTSNKQRIDAHRFYRTLGFAQSHEGFKLYL